MRKDEHETRKKEEFIGLPDDKKLLIQMRKEMWEQLRRLSFELDISMAALCREGITVVLEKYKEVIEDTKK